MSGGMPRAGGHGTVELSSVLAPSSHLLISTSAGRVPIPRAKGQAMTMFGVALHRSIKLWLQRAGQSSCSVYEGTTDMIRLKLNARVYEKRG